MGNVVAATDPKGNTSTTTFSSTYNYAFPEVVTNALGHQMHYSWYQYSVSDVDGSTYYNVQNGDLYWTKDPNGVLVLQFWYDVLGRKTQEKTPAETRNFSYDDLTYLATHSSSSGYQYGKTNPAGNLIERDQSDPAGANIRQTQGFDNPWGQPSSISAPYRADSTGGFISYTYDALGRIASAGFVGTYQYSGNEATLTSPENKKRKYTYNEFGQVSKVTEPDSLGNLTLITTYAYNTLGKLTQIVQGSQICSLLLGQLQANVECCAGARLETAATNVSRRSVRLPG